MKNNLIPKILLVGGSGSGKNTVQNYLVSKYKLMPLLSYTTREKRFPSEDTHTFITEDEYQKMKQNEKIIAYTYYNNHHYFATESQFAESDVYIIDINGIKYLKEHSNIPFVVFYLDVSELERINRMKNRGDTTQQINERISFDRKAFKQNNCLYDYVIENIDYQTTAENIYRLWQYEISKYQKKAKIISMSYNKNKNITNTTINDDEIVDTERTIIDHIKQIQTLMLKLNPNIEHIEINVYDTALGSTSNSMDVFGCNYEYITSNNPSYVVEFRTYTNESSQITYLKNVTGYKEIGDIRIE